jgi:hypothetical protein
MKELDMQKYWVEGTFLTKQALQRAKKILSGPQKSDRKKGKR